MPRRFGSAGQFSAMKERHEKSSKLGRICTGSITVEGRLTTGGRTPFGGDRDGVSGRLADGPVNASHESSPTPKAIRGNRRVKERIELVSFRSATTANCMVARGLSHVKRFRLRLYAGAEELPDLGRNCPAGMLCARASEAAVVNSRAACLPERREA